MRKIYEDFTATIPRKDLINQQFQKEVECVGMDEWTSQVVVNNVHYTIVVNKIYSASLDEFLFEVEIREKSKVVYASSINLYSKREVEEWIRQRLNYESLEFNWVESE